MQEENTDELDQSLRGEMMLETSCENFFRSVSHISEIKRVCDAVPPVVTNLDIQEVTAFPALRRPTWIFSSN